MGDVVKSSEFNVLVDSLFEDVFLLFNAFTGSIIELSPIEALVCETLREHQHLSENTMAEISRLRLGDSLVDGGFIVGDSVEERSTLKAAYWSQRDAIETGDLSLTISPTVSCNFRCSYCFEEHPERYFSEQDIDSLSSFVEANLSDGGSLGVVWFGGEPLRGFEQMVEIHRRLSLISSEKGASFHNSMITNGSLISGERRAWVTENIDSVQITIDGPREIHDKRRITINGKGSYDLILRNLKQYAPHVDTCVRINVDKRNLAFVDELLDRLVDAGLHQFVSVDIGHLQSYTDACGGGLSQNSLSKEESARARVQLVYELCRRGFMRSLPKLPSPKNTYLCVADNPNGYVVSPGSLVFGCWNELSNPLSKASGVLVDGVVETSNEAIQQEWAQYDPFAHQECQTCKVQPLCKGGCPWLSREKCLSGAGDCTPLRYTIADTVRLGHLRETHDVKPGMEA